MDTRHLVWQCVNSRECKLEVLKFYRENNLNAECADTGREE